MLKPSSLLESFPPHSEDYVQSVRYPPSPHSLADRVTATRAVVEHRSASNRHNDFPTCKYRHNRPPLKPPSLKFHVAMLVRIFVVLWSCALFCILVSCMGHHSNTL